MDRILLPLRSNAGWFTDADSQAEQRLKNYLVTFDQGWSKKQRVSPHSDVEQDPCASELESMSAET